MNSSDIPDGATHSTPQPIVPTPPAPHRSNRLMWWAILVLAVLNVGTLLVLWRQHHCAMRTRECGDAQCEAPPHGDAMPPRGPAAFEFIVHETQMNDAQRHSYEKLRDEHQQAIRPLRDSVRSLRETLFQQLANADEQTRLQQLHVVATLTMQQDSITVKHFQQVRALLNNDQQKRFDVIISDATRMMGGPPPPPPEGPRDRDPRDHEPNDGPPPPEHHHPDPH